MVFEFWVLRLVLYWAHSVQDSMLISKILALDHLIRNGLVLGISVRQFTYNFCLNKILTKRCEIRRKKKLTHGKFERNAILYMDNGFDALEPIDPPHDYMNASFWPSKPSIINQGQCPFRNFFNKISFIQSDTSNALLFVSIVVNRPRQILFFIQN